MADESRWLSTLRAEVERTSLRRVAERLRGGNGYPSETLLSQVLNDKYKGQTERLQRLVEGYYLGQTVTCPVRGALTRDRCEHNRRLPFSNANADCIALYRACKTCIHNQETTDA